MKGVGTSPFSNIIPMEEMGVNFKWQKISVAGNQPQLKIQN
jgi:hypothetical protein